MIWISHKHADHHLGLGLLLAMRPSDCPPLAIICPAPIISWLAEISMVDKRLAGRFFCVPCAHTARSFPPPGYNRNPNALQRRRLANQVPLTSGQLGHTMAVLGLSDLESVSVNHCHLAFGLVMKHSSGWTLVYSGDTRPDQRLWTVGRGADVLIHEATFDSDMVEDARAKRHSTVAEAILVGKNMAARHVILTHFSQRYPKLPSLSHGGGAMVAAAPAPAAPGSTGGVESMLGAGVGGGAAAAAEMPMPVPSAAEKSNNDDDNNNVTVAFDFMSVRLSELAWAPALLPGLQLLYPEAEKEGEDDEDAGGEIAAEEI